VNKAMISAAQTKAYAREGAHPVRVDLGELEKLGYEVHQSDLLDRMDLVRHDGRKLAEEILVLAGAYGKHKNGEWAV